MARRMKIFKVFVGLVICAALLLVILYLHESFFLKTSHHRVSLLPDASVDTENNCGGGGRRFAVFSCATPAVNSHRGFDYAFYLPLTAMAWRRIGFESIIIIVGDRSEWITHPILSHVLVALERLPDTATVLFLSAEVENRVMLSQVARICIANMKEFPGRSSDFIMTTDADLWPLRREHYYQPEGINASKLMLMHSECCGSFSLGGRSYTMLPINVGASAATWREIINAGNSSSTSAVSTMKDSADILNYFQQMFGERVRNSVAFASDDWYMDQKMMSIRIEQWINRQHSTNNNNQSVYYKVSDDGLLRLDRLYWNADEIRPTSFAYYYDAHLILDGFLPENWESIQPLLRLMYGKNSTAYEFCNRYATEFYTQFTKWEANDEALEKSR